MTEAGTREAPLLSVKTVPDTFLLLKAPPAAWVGP
jgi:hypothetical protein